MVSYRDWMEPTDQVTFAKGAGTPAAVTVTDAAGGTQIVAANPARKALIIVNNGAQTVYVGASGVTINNGLPLQAYGGRLSDDVSTDAYYGIVAAGNADVRYKEVV